jgi:hypothetical protein
MTTRALCLSLDLDFEGDRVTGRLADEHGNDWAFSCWLDLLMLIERVLAGTRTPAGQPAQCEGTTTTPAPARRRLKGAVIDR